MIIRMKQDAKLSDISSIVEQLEKRGNSAVVFPKPGVTIIGIQSGLNPSKEDFAGISGISEIVEETQPYKLVSRDFHPDDLVIKIGCNKIGGGRFCVMAGPCSVESEEMIFETARYCKEAGANILRGGAFKPRTSPYSFQGMGEEGLRLLADAGKRFGLPVVTEVLSSELAELVARYADILQIGARNMQNFKLLEAVGKCGKPVLLKRGLNATIKELLLAAEYVYLNGSSEIMLCERGIRTFETYTRNTLDISAIPALKALSHLPVIIDPSHAAGRREMVLPLSRAALAAGADGLMIETHPFPEKALSDGDQSLPPELFTETLRAIKAFHARLEGLVGRPAE
jgi:3-deoxy-7-phosphoheptulonate synthase